MEMQASNENESYNKARGLSPPSKSPAVRVHINVESNKPPAQEVIRKVTQAHEVVEVDGFVFKRKRSVPETLAGAIEQDQPADKKQKLPAIAQDENALPADESAIPAPVAAAAEADVAPNMAAIKTPDAQLVSAATTALMEQLPSDVSESDRLASLCELLCAAELDELSASSAQRQQLDPVADAVRDVLGTFVLSVQTSAAAGRFQAAPSAPVYRPQQQDAVQDDVVFSVDLEARKAGLRAQLAAFVKEEEEWQEVLAQQDTCQQPAAPLQTPAEAPGNPGDGPANSLAPGTASNAQAATSAANAGRDSRVEGEQAEMTDALVPAGIEQAEVAAAPDFSSSALQSGAGLLRKAEVDAHRKVAMQVEGLCSMVSGVEELVAKAKKHCTNMQAKYHQDRFCTLPHVDSPAKLIQELLRPGGAVPATSQ